MESTLQSGIATDVSALPLTVQKWAQLVESAATCTVFQSYQWFNAWWRTFATDRQLRFLWILERGEIVAFAPMMLTTANGLRKLEFVGAGNADYLDFCYPQDRPDLLAALLECLQHCGHEWDIVRLANLPTHSVTFQHLRSSARRHGMRYLHEATVLCPTLVLTDRVEQVRGIIDKYSVRRKLKWFAKQGDLKIAHYADAAGIEAQLDGFFAQHAQRWQGRDAHSQFQKSEQRDFFRSLARELSPNGAILFTAVTLDGVPLAYHFGFDDGKRLLWYKPSFNTQYKNHSPGVVLIHALIEEALRRGREEFDYTVGAEAFKFRFSNAVRANAYVNLYRTRGRYNLALALHLLRAATKRVVRPLRAVFRTRAPTGG